MQRHIEKYYHKDNHDVADFLLRLALAIIFIHHGWGKLSDMAGTLKFFNSLGLPTYLAYLDTWIELLGGIFIILGVWVRPIAWFFVIIMIGVISFVKSPLGLWGHELELTLLLVSLAVAYLPTGRFTVRKLFKN